MEQRNRNFTSNPIRDSLIQKAIKFTKSFVTGEIPYTIIIVGSVAHGGVTEKSDIDFFIVFHNKEDILKILKHNNLELKKRDLKKFEECNSDDYFGYNFRTQFLHKDITAILIDMNFLRIICEYRDVNMYVFRNYIPNKPHCLNSIKGDNLFIRRFYLKLNRNLAISDWICFRKK